jgi:pyridoxal phosphate enzyme (YggS family)
LDQACHRFGRDPADVRLLPVTKTQPARLIAALAAAGCHQVGENRVQEMAAKAAQLADLDLSWVLIGHLQTNKASLAAQLAVQIQSLDSLKLAAALDRAGQRLGRSITVLIEVNTSAEATKFGLPVEAVEGFSRQLRAYAALNPLGLMTVAAAGQDRSVACFQALAQLRQRLQQRDGGGWEQLSMGMSGDFEQAIACGSTCLRIGQAIFGPRPAA